MKRTIVVCGHGGGISDAVARRFGREGYAVAIVARSAERLFAAAEALKSEGIEVRAFPCDLGDPEAVRAMIRDARSLGPIGIVHWNAYQGGAGDLLTGGTDELKAAFDVSVTGLVAAVQEALPDLKEGKGSLLVTGGGFAFYDPQVDATAVQWHAMGLAIAKAAQHKAVGLLHHRLRAEGVYVGEAVVIGAVKGTAFDGGQATLEASTVAGKLWELHTERGVASVIVS